jgi:biotin synthase
MNIKIRNNWTFEEIKEIYHLSMVDLVFKAMEVHREFHDPKKMKISTLISVKTGACVEDCSYCSQSSKYHTGIDHSTMTVEEVVESARQSKENGVSRVCLSASWRKVPNDKQFDNILQMVHKVKELDLNVCCTLGMISVDQAKKLAEAGITAYNHNLDTSENYYSKIVSTRKYSDRLETLNNLMTAKVPTCTGGIIGLGETEDDRISMLHTIATLEKHPYTVPFNTLVPIPGTPMENRPLVPVWDMVRMIATARIIMPETIVCLAAGRSEMSDESQALCFMVGANSIFVGAKLLTTPNPNYEHDMNLLKILGINNIDLNKEMKN